jgi:plastocyanin
MHGAIIVADVIHEVSIGDDFFAPAAITVNVGDVVRWTHIGTEGEPHTSTSRGRFWNSGTLFEGDTFEFQFNDIGMFNYFCFYHSAIMQGVVDVTDAGISKAVAVSSSETGLPIPAQEIARETKLLGNYPNPFNPSTTIRYTLAEEAYVTLKIYNTLGQEVATLANELQTAGDKSAVWNGTNQEGARVSSGIYIYRIQAGDFVRTQRMILMK